MNLEQKSFFKKQLLVILLYVVLLFPLVSLINDYEVENYLKVIVYSIFLLSTVAYTIWIKQGLKDRE